MTATPPGGSPRPTVHLTPPTGWLNDPLGVTFHAGRYHLFYQAVPDAPTWQPWCSWAHASSVDLVTWEHHPLALAPGEGDLGCWSGDVVVTPQDGAVLFYTSVNEPDLDAGAIRTARPADDSWLHWHKGDVVLRAPIPLRIFRDPTVFREADGWRMLVGAAYPDRRPAVLTFTSDDLAAWAFDGALVEGEPPADHHLGWECPHLVLLDGVAVLIVSIWTDGHTNHVEAAIGSYAQGRFTPRRWQRLSYGGHYAPTTFVDAEGLPCVIFWLREVADRAAGWTGALSVPYRMSVVDGALRLTPHPKVRAALDGRGFTTLDERTPLGSGPLTVLVDGPVTEICAGTTLVGLTARLT